jgi:uncharacterized membrane protein YesL
MQYLIDFPLQQGLHERPSILRYTYIAALFLYLFMPSIDIEAWVLSITVHYGLQLFDIVAHSFLYQFNIT